MENMSIINKIPKDKHFFPKIRSENSEEKNNRDEFNSIDGLSKEDGKYTQIISNYILKLNDTDFGL
jgi:hypothetical protein